MRVFVKLISMAGLGLTLVPAFLVVKSSQLRRVSGVAEFDETNAFHHPAGVHVQARDYAFGQHGESVSPVVLRSSLKYNTVPGRDRDFPPIGVASRLR